MPVTTRSPLAMLVQSGLESIGPCPARSAFRDTPDTPAETVEQIAAALLMAMALREISDELDLQGVALLGTACVIGLQALGELEPGAHRLNAAIFAFEDLLRRTAPAEAR